MRFMVISCGRSRLVFALASILYHYSMEGLRIVAGGEGGCAAVSRT